MRTIIKTRRVPSVGQARAPAAKFVSAFVEVWRRDPLEKCLFGIFVAALAWVPFWYGSNDWIAWGINAIIFPAAAACYETSLLVRRQPHAVAIRNIAVPAALFACVVLWIAAQTITWNSGWPANPIWGLAGTALGHPVKGSISVDRDATILALMRLLTTACAFWLALQLCRERNRAHLLIAGVVAIEVGYALYGFVAAKFGTLPLLHFIRADGVLISATFINPDSFASYVAIGLAAVVGLALEFYGRGMRDAEGSWRLQVAFFIERTGRQGAVLLSAGFLLLAALLVTGSRGGTMGAGLGVCGLVILTRRRERAALPWLLIVIGSAFIVGVMFQFGDAVGNKLAESGLRDDYRFSIYLLTLRSILNEPLLGYGYGTFAEVFPMYRDRSIGVLGVLSQAHNTYLEVFQGLGLIFGSMLIACLVILVARCVRGALTRERDTVSPAVAASAAIVVAAHALVDFSLQIQAIAITFAALLGAGVAQSQSSRAALQD